VKFTSISGGFLLQDGDDRPIVKDDFQVVTQIQPTAEQLEALIFGAKAVKWAKSNAVVLCNRYQTLGIGAGQTSRVGAVEIAVANAERFGHDLNGAIMASDAFFPFPDSVEEAAKVGVKAIVQPGGSVKDREVIKAADDLGLAMVFSGKRHFRH
jgi:phosphoribosylaminoimidazolecarboxamide formyltransferase/IMP cyclohydrolase